MSDARLSSPKSGAGPVLGHARPFSVAPLIAGFLLLVAVVAATGGLIAMQRGNVADTRRTVELRASVLRLFSMLQDVETSQRGYLLTGEDAYLGPFNEAQAQITTALDRIADATMEEPDFGAALNELRTVTADKFAELRRTIDLRRSGETETSLSVVRSGEGKRLMDRARRIIERLETEVDARLRSRQDGAARTARFLQVAIAAAVLLAVSLAAYALFDAAARNRRIAAAHGELAKAHEALLRISAERARLEEQLRQSQKMEAMGQLTGGLAHDFNNMLAIIMGNLNLLKRRIERGEGRLNSYVQQALEGGARAATLTHRLLAFARKQPLSPEPIDGNRLVPAMSELLRRTLGERVRVETVLAGGLWPTKVDANQLESALLNLAVNARDAMPEGGRLTIETANAHLDDAYAEAHPGIPAGQYVLIAVTDTGAGMSPEVAARAFDPFFTTKAVGQGTGLGLSQVYGFVRQSGGHVKIYSEAGSGTSVKIYLPRLVVAEVAASDAGLRDIPVPEGDPRHIILVVEDEDGVRRMAVEALRDLSYTVIHATGGAHALRLLEEHPEVSLLFTDVVMPEMSGKELADAARLRRPDLRVLYTTGYTRNAIVHNGVVDADVQLLGKPYTLEQLARKVRQVIAAQAA
ncbi:signal transduction histidine kinase/CheY-like chemotaxis protein [Methylobacterium sp. BE186]|uniref:CHASE3 domain-containing protein n=1 Tax=Methylobacterium sp. BE186 TaxID=2817715 RepID=UPI00286585F8|nr:CHASE3 domain-containing protein [Methylobacterium sp. BE186]MDR7036924.1 signal transduction histidine kinase/CheY-like chemotaxis protein [Methylobacterium sp. BE186]